MSRKSERRADLVRMLNLLPYFEAHPDRSVMEAARDLVRTPEEIMSDLNRLWCCGLPGVNNFLLVEMKHDYRRVQVTDSLGMDKPLRLTTTEAAALLLALENLESTPGLVNKSAVVSAAEKLRGIMGPKVDAVIDTTVDAPLDETLEQIRIAMDGDRQLSFDYFSQSDYTTRTRVVSPAHLFSREGFTYLTAWDGNLKSHRTFRTDRMNDVQVLDEASTPHLEKLKFNEQQPFRFGRHIADVAVAEHFAWIAQESPLELTGPAKSGWIPGQIPVGSEEWLIRFVLACEGHILLTAPAHLKQSVFERAEAGLRAYDETTNS